MCQVLGGWTTGEQNRPDLSHSSSTVEVHENATV